MSPRSKPTRLPVEQIAVGQRYRKDLGDLRSLAASIEEVGLLHPIVVTPQGRLIAGQRRLKACVLLGWAEVPVTVVDLLQAARGEAHENFVRAARDITLEVQDVGGDEISQPAHTGTKPRQSGRQRGEPAWV